MSSSATQFRANENGALYNSLKNRDSALGGAGNRFLYSAERNDAPHCITKLKIGAQNSVGYDRVVRFELANYGMLHKLYLKVQYGPGTHTASTTVGVALTRYPLPFTECKITYQGQTIARISDDYIISWLNHSADGTRKEMLDEMLCNVPLTHVAGSSNLIAAGSNQANADRNSTHAEARTIAGGSASAGNLGNQYLYIPLDFWFSDSLSRSLDLSVLSSPCFLEVSTRSQSECHALITTAGTGCPLVNMEAICYMRELHADERRAFNQVSYIPGGTPLTQIGWSTTTFIKSNVAYNVADSIKLNSFSGQVKKLYVWARDHASAGVHSATIGTNRWDLMPFKKIILKSAGTEIYKMEHLSTEDEKLLELYNSHGQYLPQLIKNDGVARPVATANAGGGQVAWENVYCINFGEGVNRSDASGSLNFSALSIPELEYELETVAGADKSNKVADSGNVDIVIVSENLNLISYITSGNGATHIRSLTE